MNRKVFAAVLVFGLSAVAFAQGGRPASPSGVSAAQVGGAWSNGPNRAYRGGKWVEILYGRPLKRGRDLWGSGATYGKTLNDEAPAWRAGANVSTRLKTEAPLVIAGTTVAPGEYTMFIDLKPNAWTLIVSRWGASQVENPTGKTSIWGAYGYTPDKDVVRSPMKLETLTSSVEQLTWNFADVTDAGGRLVLTWDKVMASAPFTVGK
jgi:hypothetical protein